MAYFQHVLLELNVTVLTPAQNLTKQHTYLQIKCDKRDGLTRWRDKAGPEFTHNWGNASCLLGADHADQYA